ncbi:MAG: hypothetical protein ACRCTR_07735 [Actinomycetota bacterium]
MPQITLNRHVAYAALAAIVAAIALFSPSSPVSLSGNAFEVKQVRAFDDCGGCGQGNDIY